MTKSVRLSPDGGKLEELARLREQLAAAKAVELSAGEGLASDVPELERRVKAVMAAALTSGPVYTFRKLTRREKADITREFPPTVEQWEHYREKAKAYPGYVLPAPEFDQVSAAPKVISVAAVDPPLTLEQATALWDDSSDSDAVLLWHGAWVDSDTVRPISGIGIDETANTGPVSTSPVNTESL